MINVLDQNFGSLENVMVKIIIENKTRDEHIFEGATDRIGQVLFMHQYKRPGKIYLNGDFHSTVRLPCMKTISIGDQYLKRKKCLMDSK